MTLIPMTAEDIHAERNLDCTIRESRLIEQAVIEAYVGNYILDEENIVTYVLNHVPEATEHDARVLTQEFLEFSDFVGKYTSP